MKKCLAFTMMTILAISSWAQGNPMLVNIIQTEPLGFTDASGNAMGIHYDILMELSKRSEIPFNIRIVPKARLIGELMKNRVDAAVFFPTPDTDAVTVNAGTTDVVKLMALAKKGTPLKSYADIVAASTVLTMAKMSLGEPFDSDATLKKTEVLDYESLVRMHVGDRGKVAIGNLIVMFYQLKKQGVEDVLDPTGFLLRKAENKLHISQKSSFVGQAGKLKAILEEMESTGVIEKIIVHYAGSEWKKY